MKTVGKHTYGAETIAIRFADQGSSLIVGSFCSIAMSVQVFLGGNHDLKRVSTYPFGAIKEDRDIFNKKILYPRKSVTNGDVVIGNDVWIGHGVTIMSGVKIGDGAVIAANAHVVQSVKPYSVVGGNPAEFYFFRFEKEAIDRLLKLKWWNLEDDVINELSPALSSSDPNLLFEMCTKMGIGPKGE